MVRVSRAFDGMDGDTDGSMWLCGTRALGSDPKSTTVGAVGPRAIPRGA